MRFLFPPKASIWLREWLWLKKHGYFHWNCTDVNNYVGDVKLHLKVER